MPTTLLVIVHVTIPAAVVAACGTHTKLRTALAHAGLLSDGGEEERWQVDPVGGGFLVQTRVPLVVEGQK